MRIPIRLVVPPAAALAVLTGPFLQGLQGLEGRHRLQGPQEQGAWAVVETFHIGGQGGWDYLTVDPRTHRLYVPRSTHTMVIDAESGATIADIPGQKIAHGVAIAPAAGRGFISDGGGDGAVVIFDLKTYAVLGSIVAKPDTDGIIFDSASGRILVVSGRGKVLMSLRPDVDPKSGAIDAPIELGGEPEFLAADGRGKVYVNLMDTNESCGGRSQRAKGRRPLAGCARRQTGRHVNGHKQRTSLHRLPRATEARRDEHQRRQSDLGPSDR